MFEIPSDIIAAKFRDEGSAFYRQNKSYKALVCYNKSLCFSESNEVKSLAFANRSAVYIETKKFQHCLDNIQLARDHEYPADKMSKLDAREVKCKEMMEQHRPDLREDPWNFFKLSYPANKKLPFMVDCMELREDAKYGRHIITNRDLKPGDIIAIEEPFLKWLDSSHCYERCNSCLKANMLSLIPCKGRCVNTMFCSEKCAKVAESRHRQFECSKRIHDSAILVQKLIADSITIAGGIKELQTCFEEDKKLTIFDIDMTNPDDPQVKKKQLMAFLALMLNPRQLNEQEKASAENFASFFLRNLWETPEEFELLVGTTCRLARIKTLNAYDFSSMNFFNESSDWKLVTFGKMIALFGSLFNHSCDPNVRWYIVDNKLVAVVQVPIKAGAQLFVCYNEPYYSVPILLREERRELLLKDFHFHCDCNACQIDLKLNKMQCTDENFEFPTYFLSVAQEPIEEFKKNCKYIEKNINNHPWDSWETIVLINCNIHLLSQISQLGSLQQ